jgi:hypothetical protein
MGDASAVPALEKRGARCAQRTRGVVCARPETPRLGLEGSDIARQIGDARVRLAEDQAIEESPAAVGPDHRVAMPVGCRPVPDVCVQGGTGTLVLIAGALVMIAEFHNRHEPVPVQHGHVVVTVGPRVPAQQVIVIDADFTGGIMMADVVIVGLGQRHVHQAENENSHSQVACRPPESAPKRRHHLASFWIDLRVSSGVARKKPCGADELLRHSKHYEPAS